MKKIVKLTESDLMNIIKKVVKEANVTTSPSKVAGPGNCTGSSFVHLDNCRMACNGAGGYTAAQGSAQISNICVDPIVPVTCVCSKGGKTR